MGVAGSKSRKPRRSDGTCRECGYDLSGLAPGGRCPECGAGIPIRSRRLIMDSLAMAPTWFLRRLVVGAFCAAVGGIGGLGGLFFPPPIKGWLFVALACFLLWNIGVWIMTCPHQSTVDMVTDFRREGRLSRWAARGTQWAWAVGLGLLIASAEIELSAIKAGLKPNLDLVQGLARGGWAAIVLGLIGLVPVCAQMASLAEWAGNQWTGEWMRGASLGMVVGPVLLLAAMASNWSNFALTVLGVLGGLLLVVSIGLLAFGLAQTAVMSIWALSAVHQTAERDKRLAAKAEEHTRELIARTGGTPADPLAVRGARPAARPADPEDRSPIALEPGRPAGPRTIRHERPAQLDAKREPEPPSGDSYTVL